jgi:hypothetical protein
MRTFFAGLHLCGLQSELKECTFGMWKQCFPCLWSLRKYLEMAKKTIVASAVLHNLSILWANNDELNDNNHEVIRIHSVIFNEDHTGAEAV